MLTSLRERASCISTNSACSCIGMDDIFGLQRHRHSMCVVCADLLFHMGSECCLCSRKTLADSACPIVPEVQRGTSHRTRKNQTKGRGSRRARRAPHCAPSRTWPPWMQRRTRVTRITRAAGNKKPLARVVRKEYIYTGWVAGDLGLLLARPCGPSEIVIAPKPATLNSGVANRTWMVESK